MHLSNLYVTSMQRQPRAILFDLGNTLVSYYRKEEFSPILAQSLNNVLDALRKESVETISPDLAWERGIAENREAQDYRVTPLTERLARIFALEQADDSDIAERLCPAFMEPIFQTGYLYDDTLPVLRELKERGYTTGIVSNTPWGSAPELWRSELNRLGLTELLDDCTFCGDAGWRKPDARVFLRATHNLDVECDDCMFVGDDLRWDVEGSSNLGMRPVLIDRGGYHSDIAGERITTLEELLPLLSTD